MTGLITAQPRQYLTVLWPLLHQRFLFPHLEKGEIKGGGDGATDQGESLFAGNVGGEPRSGFHDQRQVFSGVFSQPRHGIFPRGVDLMDIQGCAVVEVPDLGVGEAVKTGEVFALEQVMDRGAGACGFAVGWGDGKRRAVNLSIESAFGVGKEVEAGDPVLGG